MLEAVTGTDEYVALELVTEALVDYGLLFKELLYMTVSTRILVALLSQVI